MRSEKRGMADARAVGAELEPPAAVHRGPDGSGPLRPQPPGDDGTTIGRRSGWSGRSGWIGLSMVRMVSKMLAQSLRSLPASQQTPKISIAVVPQIFYFSLFSKSSSNRIHADLGDASSSLSAIRNSD